MNRQPLQLRSGLTKNKRIETKRPLQRSSSRIIRIKLHGKPASVLAPKRPSRTVIASAGEAREYALLDSVYDAALITTMDGVVVSANSRAVSFFQYSRAEMRGFAIEQLLNRVETDLLSRLRPHLEQNRFVLIQCYGVRKDGTAFPAEVAANHLRRPNDRICFLVRNITARKQQEDQLRTVSLAMENAPVGIAAITTDGLIQYANPSFVHVFGLDARVSPIGLRFTDLIADSDLAANLLREVIVGQREWTGEMNARRPDESLIPIRVTANCNRDSEGTVSGAVLSVLDITDAKRSEELLRKTARQEAMLASLTAACHHLAQPATVILGHLDLLTQELDTKSRAHVLARGAADAAHQLACLLHKLNRVEDYRTTPYLESAPATDPENRMLDI